MTNAELAVKYLVQHGWREERSPRTSKYRVFVKTGWKHKYLVGRNGAVRRQDGESMAHTLSLTAYYERTVYGINQG